MFEEPYSHLRSFFLLIEDFEAEIERDATNNSNQTPDFTDFYLPTVGWL